MASRKKQQPRARTTRSRQQDDAKTAAAEAQPDPAETIIDGKAEHVEDTAAKPQTEKTQKHTQSGTPKDKPAKSANSQRPSVFGRGVLTIGVIISLGLSGFVLFSQMNTPQTVNRMYTLEAQIAELSDDLEALRADQANAVQRSQLDSVVRQFTAELAGLTETVNTLMAAPPVAGDTVDLSPVKDRIARLEEELQALSTIVQTAQTEQPSPPPESNAATATAEDEGWMSFFGDLFRITRIEDEAK